jgi:hypothetical protein
VSRALALTMPAVTVFSSPKGEPMAITHSPTFRRLTSPIFTKGRPVASIFTTATSVRLSAPMMRALNSRLSVSVTMTSSAPSTTCALVMMKPSALRMKPEPTPRCCGSSSPPPRGARRGSGAARQRDAEAAEELLHVGVDVRRRRPHAPRSRVRMLTTDGPTVKSARPVR